MSFERFSRSSTESYFSPRINTSGKLCLLWSAATVFRGNIVEQATVPAVLPQLMSPLPQYSHHSHYHATLWFVVVIHCILSTPYALLHTQRGNFVFLPSSEFQIMCLYRSSHQMQQWLAHHNHCANGRCGNYEVDAKFSQTLIFTNTVNVGLSNFTYFYLLSAVVWPSCMQHWFLVHGRHLCKTSLSEKLPVLTRVLLIQWIRLLFSYGSLSAKSLNVVFVVKYKNNMGLNSDIVHQYAPVTVSDEMKELSSWDRKAKLTGSGNRSLTAR